MTFFRIKLYKFRKTHDRRTPYDRRSAKVQVENAMRSGDERRKGEEKRSSWVRFSKWSSILNRPHFERAAFPCCPMMSVPFCGPEHCWKKPGGYTPTR